MNNKEVMTALLRGYKLCNPNWNCNYIHLVGNDILQDDGSPMSLTLAYIYSGETRVYIEPLFKNQI